MIIHLKRFVKRVSRNYVTFNKINDFIDYPITDWNLKDFCIPCPNNNSVVYDLIGVVNHYGKMGGGHYIAVANNFVKERWIKFDDEDVSFAQEDDIINRYAYVLFYKRRRK